MNSNTNSENKKSITLNSIKSKYFLVNLFKHIKHIKSLDIMRYNKTIQTRLHITLETYKKYSQTFTPIEIELIPEKEKYCKIIHFLNDEEKQYYHIYINNSKEEIKRNYLNKNDDLTNIKIKIIIDYKIKSFEKLFLNCKNITSIDFKKFYRNNITNMSEMFSGCESLKLLNLTSFNTESVSNMSNMFNNCSSLRELNVSKFNTENVTEMNDMFTDCTSLEELDLSNFNTSNVTNMEYMFLRCNSLKKINMSNFKTDKVTNMGSMFCRCSLLEELNLESFNTCNVETMSDMFSWCWSLKELKISSNFTIDNVSDIWSMFEGCSDEIKKKMKENIKNIKDEAF